MFSSSGSSRPPLLFFFSNSIESMSEVLTSWHNALIIYSVLSSHSSFSDLSVFKGRSASSCLVWPVSSVEVALEMAFRA